MSIDRSSTPPEKSPPTIGFGSKERHRLPRNPAKYYFHRDYGFVIGACHASRDSPRVIGESDVERTELPARFVVHHRSKRDGDTPDNEYYCPRRREGGGGGDSSSRSICRIDSSRFQLLPRLKNSLEKRSRGISRKSFDLLFFLFLLTSLARSSKLAFLLRGSYRDLT